MQHYPNRLTFPAWSYLTANDVEDELTEMIQFKAQQRLLSALKHDLLEALKDATSNISELRSYGYQSLSERVEKISLDPSSASALGRALDEIGDEIVAAVLTTLRRETLLLPDASEEALQQIVSLPQDAALETETVQALNTLQGLCLLHARSKLLATTNGVLPLVIKLLGLGSERLASYCLDVLVSIQISSPEDQHSFLQLQGLEAVAQTLTSPDPSMAMRCKTAEFLLLLMGTLSSEPPPPGGGTASVEDGTPAPTSSPMDIAKAKLRSLLGDKAMRLLCSTLDLAHYDNGKAQLSSIVASIVQEVGRR